MEVQSLPEEPSIVITPSSHFPTGPVTPPPTGVSFEMTEELRDLCRKGDIKKIQEVLDSEFPASDHESFAEYNLSNVALNLIEQDATPFLIQLLNRGLHLNKYWALSAVRAKAKKTLETFVEHGWDINQPMSALEPPILHKAIDDEEMATWLLDHGADPNRQDVIDLTPLSCAVESAPMSIVHLMLNRDGDIKKGQLMLHAINRKSEAEAIELIKLFIAKGADIDATMYQDHPFSWGMYFFGLGTVLHKAAELGKVQVVSYLLATAAEHHQGCEWAYGVTKTRMKLQTLRQAE